MTLKSALLAEEACCKFMLKHDTKITSDNSRDFKPLFLVNHNTRGSGNK